jgi:hypothetical protein
MSRVTINNSSTLSKLSNSYSRPLNTTSFLTNPYLNTTENPMVPIKEIEYKDIVSKIKTITDTKILKELLEIFHNPPEDAN